MERNRFLQLAKERYEVIVFAVFVTVLSIGVARHEPWMDEAQAWLLAKDAGLQELFVRYLRYEGSPGLWHVLLMLPAKLGLPYFTISIISAIAASAGVWLFLRYSPFPVIVKILFPFSFFVLFQYGVVARSYCLIAPVLFLLAINYHSKIERPFLFVFLLCLLANISAHTFLIAGAIAFVHFIDIITSWKNLSLQSKRKQLFALAIFGLVGLFVIYTIMTPPDQLYAGRANWKFDNYSKISRMMMGGSLLVNEIGKPSWFSGALSTAVFIVSLVWFKKQKVALLYFLPLLLLCTLFAVKYRNYWHQGVLFFLWVFALWISLQKPSDRNSSKLYKGVLAGVALVLSVQVYWCIAALRSDFNHNYSASRSVASYIKTKGLEKEKIFVSGWKNISILPYFNQNIFYNHNNGSSQRFWNWSVNNVTSVGAAPDVIDTILCRQPDVVIFSSDHIPRNSRIPLPGYKPVALFKGALSWKTGVLEPESYLIFVKQEFD